MVVVNRRSTQNREVFPRSQGRLNRAEVVAALIVALPIVFSVPYHAPQAFQSLRANYRLDAAAAVALAPPVITARRNLPLAQRSLALIAPGETYSVVQRLQAPPRTAARRRERAELRYFESWLQYWLAPRIRVDPAAAEWLILLSATEEPPPTGALEVYRFGSDLVVRRA